MHSLVKMRQVHMLAKKSVKLIAAHLNEWDSKLLLQKLVKILESAVG